MGCIWPEGYNLPNPVSDIHALTKPRGCHSQIYSRVSFKKEDLSKSSYLSQHDYKVVIDSTKGFIYFFGFGQ